MASGTGTMAGMAAPTDIMEKIRQGQEAKAQAAQMEAGRRQAAALRAMADLAERGAVACLCGVVLVYTEQGVGVNTLLHDHPEHRMHMIGALKVLNDGFSQAEWNDRTNAAAKAAQVRNDA